MLRPLAMLAAIAALALAPAGYAAAEGTQSHGSGGGAGKLTDSATTGQAAGGQSNGALHCAKGSTPCGDACAPKGKSCPTAVSSYQSGGHGH